jgi:uncharacterized protein YecE (DUF72 family)
VFTADAPRSDWLRQYSAAFTTVEGNSTFYALPSPETAQRWASETEPGFRFALKFPRIISHERRLVDAASETRAFLRILEILHAANRLGPSFLQLPPDFSAREFEPLQRYLESLPPDFPYAVEVRHRDYFDENNRERRLEELLRLLEMDRVLFDSRALFSAPPGDEAEKISQGRKPRSPFRRTLTGARPFVRIVGRNSLAATRPWLDEWAAIVAEWITAGLTPYVFAHTPDDTFAPPMAAAFHQALRAHLKSLGPIPEWPGILESRLPRQQSLF